MLEIRLSLTEVPKTFWIVFACLHKNAKVIENGTFFDESMRAYWYLTPWRNLFQKSPFS